MRQNETIKSLPLSEQPYEKAKRLGISALSDAELIAVILRNGSEGRTVLKTAYEVLETLHGVGGFREMNPETLLRIKGIGRIKAVELCAIGELSARIWKAGREELLVCSDSASVFSYYREQMAAKQQEEVWLLLLNNRLKRIADVAVTKGTVNCSLASPRDIFRIALGYGAASFILMHNHPGGDPSPSKPDRSLTESLLSLGTVLELPLSDHIIFGKNRYFSFRDECPELFRKEPIWP